MQLFNEDSHLDMQLSQLDRYLPKKIREQVEQNYYARVNQRAELDYAARNEEFLRNPLDHVVLYSDHGVVHVQDVATNILVVLDTINGVLIPHRNTVRLEFMKGYGVMVAYNHDIGMRDFSAFGRAMHPEFAAQEIFTPLFDDIVDTIWAENCGNVAWRLAHLAEIGALDQEPRLVLREMLAMSVGHSKSKVPIEVLNDTAQLRATMLKSIESNLHHLYHQQKVVKAAQKMARVTQSAPESGPPDSAGSFRHATRILPADEARLGLAQALQKARAGQKAFLESDDAPPPTFAGLSNYYDNFETDAFQWILSEHPETHQLVSDVVDTLRALRVADALRQRGTTLKTSGGYQIFVDQNTARAVIALQKGSGELLMLESDDPLSIGEANMASSDLTHEGNLRVSFHRGAFLDDETTRLAAYSAAIVIDDIQRDVIESFIRPPADTSGLKTSREIQILIEETDDNLNFADLILVELNKINPDLGQRSRIVPSLKHISGVERNRYLRARNLNWTLEQRERVLVHVGQSGHKIKEIDPDKAFTDVRMADLKEGDILIKVGAPPGFVYVPMGEGLVSTPLGGYQAQTVPPWIPLGNTRVIRGDVQEAAITAESSIKVLMLPKEIYLKYWHDAYNVAEFSSAIERLYREDEVQEFELVLDILEQVAMIDQVLDDAEIEFILKFIEYSGIDYSAAEIKEKLLTGPPTDFVTVRQRTMDYLALSPSYLHVARLRDLINLMVSADDEVSSEEALILAELTNLLNGYLDDEDTQRLYRVYIVPQNQQQDEGVRALLPDAPQITHEWGHAYLCGEFYSRDYAEMIRERYRSLKFFAVVEVEDQEAS